MAFDKMLFMICATPLFALDILVYILSLAWVPKLLPKFLYSVAVGKATETHGAPRRSAKEPDKFITTFGAATTVFEMTKAAVKQHGDKTAMISRKFVELKKVKETDRFPSKIFDDSRLQKFTYDEFGEQIIHFGAGLRKLGLEPIPQGQKSFDETKGSFVMVIFEDTCQQWTMGIQAAFTQSITVATCYATLGDDAVVSAVNETGATALLLNWKNALKFSKLANTMPTLKTIIASTHEMPDGEPTPLPPPGSKVQIVSSDELMDLGFEEQASYPPVPPQPNDVAVIMYTSGSTGKPKGVVMTHAHLVAAVSGMAENVPIEQDDVYVSYLPLAHILALQIEIILITIGATVCYSDPRELAKALPMFQPTLFAGVPKVYEILKSALEKKIAAGSPVVELIFQNLMAWKISVIKAGFDTPVSNLFFKLISKKVFGGVLRFGVAGGGPMAESLQRFCQACFCCPIIQGYALTETCVGGCFQATEDNRCGVVGPPVPCVEVMLQSEPDIKDSAGISYLHTDTVGSKGEAVIGRGEICMRGPCVSLGYYKLPEKTKEEYDEEGWFHTGDIGQFTADGVIQIVDRKKNLVKLKGGEYVALESMENAFVASPFAVSVCVVANGDLDAPLAIVRADNEHLEQWAADEKIAYESLQELAEKQETGKAVLKSMVAAGKEAGLTALELRVRDCAIITDVEWTAGNGMTATMKIDRRQIFNMHADELNAMLKRNGVQPSK